MPNRLRREKGCLLFYYVNHITDRVLIGSIKISLAPFTRHISGRGKGHFYFTWPLVDRIADWLGTRQETILHGRWLAGWVGTRQETILHGC